jgi:hypothetical protein
MAILYNPDTLINIAVQEMANYVTYFTNWAIMISNKHYQTPCNLLEKIINIYVPPFFANEITFALIRPVNQCYNKLKNDSVFKTHCHTISPVVLKSVMHKSVKALDCNPNIAHPTLLDYYKVRNCDLIYKALSLFHGLREVRLGTAHRTDDMILDIRGFRDTLEEFSSRSCWDSDIETLARNCKQLRCLDISCSEGVTDGVVDYILMFEQLEELNLCEINSLSEDALQRLLKGLAEDKVSDGNGLLKFSDEAPSANTGTFRSQRLKIFGCNDPSDYHITMIAQFFNLTSLALSNIVKTQLTPLRCLRHLENLFLKKSVFSCATELLTCIGNQLICLNIIDVSGTDCNFISLNCQSLSCLHLCFEEVEKLCLPFENCQAEQVTLPVPEFPKVECLQLFLRDSNAADYIVTGCKNLRSLNIETRFPDIRLFVDGIRERKNLVYLERVFCESTVAFCSKKECRMFKFYSDGTTVRNTVKE